MNEALNYIDGSWREPESGQWTTAVNPADSAERLGRVARSTPGDVARATEAAHRALPGWRGLPGARRGELLAKAARLVEERADGIARTMTKEMGKTFAEARAETLRGAAILNYYAGEGMRADGEHIPPSDGKSLLYTRRIPLGVVGLITPWNFPVAIPLWKLAPALAYGNTAVLKPASNASITASLLIAAIAEAGLPPGVVNLVHGAGGTVGNALVDHPLLQGISFTGSNAIGKDIAVRAAARGLKYQLEMGGKNSVIVMEDADLEQAADLVVSGAMKSAGQKCTATSKAIVMKPVADAFTELLLARVRAIRLGDGMDPDVYSGPAATPEQQRSVLGHISRGVEEGARLLHGGKAPENRQLANGCYVEPTLFADVTPDMSLAKEEIFGPVLAVMTAESLDEAIAVANGTEYGLSAAIFTKRLDYIMPFLRDIEAGMIKVNAETAGVEYQAPFGGLKRSGSHSREQGRAAIEFYTHTQTVSISL